MNPPSADETPVAELLAAAGRGDQRSWEEIVLRFRDLVRAVARAHRLQDADARDAEQRTWLRLVERLATVRDPDRLSGWLATTAARECLRIMRECRRSVAVEMDGVCDPDDDLEQRAVDAETAAHLWRIVATLPPRSRTVMHALFAGEARPYAEVARDTGIPIGSLGPTRARVLGLVRARFEGRLAGTG